MVWALISILGVMFTGSPKVSLNADNPNFTSIPGAQAELDAQVAKTENELKGFNVYPVLSVGVSYGFLTTERWGMMNKIRSTIHHSLFSIVFRICADVVDS